MISSAVSLSFRTSFKATCSPVGTCTAAVTLDLVLTYSLLVIWKRQSGVPWAGRNTAREPEITKVAATLGAHSARISSSPSRQICVLPDRNSGSCRTIACRLAAPTGLPDGLCHARGLAARRAVARTPPSWPPPSPPTVTLGLSGVFVTQRPSRCKCPPRWALLQLIIGR